MIYNYFDLERYIGLLIEWDSTWEPFPLVPTKVVGDYGDGMLSWYWGTTEALYIRIPRHVSGYLGSIRQSARRGAPPVDSRIRADHWVSRFRSHLRTYGQPRRAPIDRESYARLQRMIDSKIR